MHGRSAEGRSADGVSMSDGQLSDSEPFSCKLAMSYGRELSQRALPKVGPQWLLPLVAVLGLGTTYVLTGPGNRSEADDAFWFADNIEHEGLRKLLGDAHTAHLLFLPLARGLFNMLRLAGIDVRAYDAVRLTNCFVAATAGGPFCAGRPGGLSASPLGRHTGAGGAPVAF